MKFLVSILLFVGLVRSQPIYETHRACVIGQNNTYYGGAIWLYNDITSGWTQVQGLAKKASFDFDGGLYVLNNIGQVYERLYGGGWGNYGTVPGLPVDICAHSASVLGVIAASTNGIYQKNGTSWSLLQSLPSIVAISSKGYAVYALMINGTVRKYDEGQMTEFPAVCSPGNAYDISVSGLGDVYVAARNTSNQDYLYKYVSGSWVQTSNTSRGIDISMITAQGLSKSVVGGTIGAWWFLSLDNTNAYNSFCPCISYDSDVAVGLEYGIAARSVKKAITDFRKIKEVYTDSLKLFFKK